jgi:hypothetical protein
MCEIWFELYHKHNYIFSMRIFYQELQTWREYETVSLFPLHLNLS